VTASASNLGPLVITVLIQAIAAIIGGIAGGIAGFLLVSLVFGGADLGMGLLALQIYGVIAGFGAGAGAGTALAGRWRRQRGSLWLAILGGVAGGVLMAVLHRFLALRLDFFFLPVYAALLAVAGALAGYHLRRRP
jgi:hypothetical protein